MSAVTTLVAPVTVSAMIRPNRISAIRSLGSSTRSGSLIESPVWRPVRQHLAQYTLKYRPVSTTANQFEFDIRAGFASDYIYRGTTLSDHKPAVGAAIEATFAQFYTGVSVASVKLPTQPSAEIAVSGGVRSKIGDIDFDLGATYYLYPGEIYYSARPKALIIGRRLSARVNGSPSRSG